MRGQRQTREMFRKQLRRRLRRRRAAGRRSTCPTGERYAWDAKSTYVKNPPYFDGMAPKPAASPTITGARVLARARRQHHDRPHLAGRQHQGRAARPAQYLIEHGVRAEDFNSYGVAPRQPRGDGARHVRQRPPANQLAPGTEGGVHAYLPTGEQMSIFDAAVHYAADGTPLVVIAGKEYGSGLVARLGGEGHRAPRRARGDRRELRAHPPLATSSAWASCRSSSRAGETARRSGSRAKRRSTSPGSPESDSAAQGHRDGQERRRSHGRIRRHRPDRYPAGARLLPARRHPPVRAPCVNYWRHSVGFLSCWRDLLNTPRAGADQETAPAAVWRAWCQSFAAEVDVDLHRVLVGTRPGHRRRRVPFDRRAHR